VPDLALVSPVTRAEETWALVAKALPNAPAVVREEGIYNAGRDKLLGIIRKVRDAHVLLIVGHNPGLHELAVSLIASGDVEARECVNEKLPTSGLVVVDLLFDDWSRLHPNAGRLERFVSPRLIKEATN
jgi:phosphohistidine phosphatase